MRTLLFSSLLALGVIGSCDRKRDDTPPVEVRKPVESAPAEPATPPAAPTANPNAEVTTIDLDAERTALTRSVDERAMRLDARIDELERKGDEKSKQAAATLRAKRDQARAMLSELGMRTEENWQTFKRDVSDAWDALERDVNEATR